MPLDYPSRCRCGFRTYDSILMIIESRGAVLCKMRCKINATAAVMQ